MTNRRSFMGASVSLLASSLLPGKTFAQAAESSSSVPGKVRPPLPVDAAKFQESTYLAYVPSGDASVDDVVQQGLEALAKKLNEKTGIEPKGVIRLDLEKDNLTLFRYIYWPVTENAQPLSAEAHKKVQKHIDKGGLIVFDRRDDSDGIKKLLGNISLRALTKMSDDHTLTRSLYQLQGLPGSRTLGDIFVDASSGIEGGGKASPVIIAAHKWADAWAGRTLHPQSRSYEMALRAGVNQVVYAFTGRYKDNSVIAKKAIQNLEK